MSEQYDEMAKITLGQWEYLWDRVTEYRTTRRVMIQSTKPHVIAERDGYRLVHQVRDAQSWPNLSDLTLERRRHDAMGGEQWESVGSWMLRAEREPVKAEEMIILVLKLLLDPGPIIDTSPRSQP